MFNLSCFIVSSFALKGNACAWFNLSCFMELEILNSNPILDLNLPPQESWNPEILVFIFGVHFEIGPLEALFLTALPTQLLNNELHCLTVHLPCKMPGKWPWNCPVCFEILESETGPEILKSWNSRSWNLEINLEIPEFKSNSNSILVGFWIGIQIEFKFNLGWVWLGLVGWWNRCWD